MKKVLANDYFQGALIIAFFLVLTVVVSFSHYKQEAESLLWQQQQSAEIMTTLEEDYNLLEERLERVKEDRHNIVLAFLLESSPMIRASKAEESVTYVTWNFMDEYILAKSLNDNEGDYPILSKYEFNQLLEDGWSFQFKSPYRSYENWHWGSLQPDGCLYSVAAQYEACGTIVPLVP